MWWVVLIFFLSFFFFFFLNGSFITILSIGWHGIFMSSCLSLPGASDG